MVLYDTTAPDVEGFHIDRYQVLETLGSGNFGVVYRVEDENGTPFAIKVLEKARRGSSELKAQFDETRLHYAVSGHPNVVTLHELLEDADTLYLVLDLCPGGDLFTAVTRTDLYLRKDELVKQTFIQLVDAVEHCHSRGIYHRDLKPENVLCSADGSQAFLTDFGLATMNETSSQFCVGSIPYMSPGTSPSL